MSFGSFILSTRTVALPMAERPMIRAPAKVKCSLQSSTLGLKSRVYRVSQWIYTSEVGGFVQIAMIAGEAEIVLGIAATVLPGPDMFNVETRERSLCLEKSAILAAIVCPLTDSLS